MTQLPPTRIHINDPDYDPYVGSRLNVYLNGEQVVDAVGYDIAQGLVWYWTYDVNGVLLNNPVTSRGVVHVEVQDDSKTPPTRTHTDDPDYDPTVGVRLAVYLDGEKVDAVLGYDIIEGWVEHWATDAKGNLLERPVLSSGIVHVEMEVPCEHYHT